MNYSRAWKGVKEGNKRIMDEKILESLKIAKKAFNDGAEHVSVFLDSRDRPISRANWDIIADGNGSTPLLAINKEICDELQKKGYVEIENTYGGFHKRAIYEFIKDKVLC
jgi:hypothetical protein